MKYKILYAILSFWICNAFIVSAQVYRRLLPDTVTNEANAVIRLDDSRFVVSDTDKGRYYEHKIVTVLNKNGDYFSRLAVLYNKFIKINHLSGKIWDRNGKLIRKIKESDFTDISLVNDETLFSDDREKYFTPQIDQYPYTLEYEINTSFNGILNYQDWTPQSDYKLGVEHSDYRLEVPPKLKIHFIISNLAHAPQRSFNGKDSVFYFEAGSLKPLVEEPLSTGITYETPHVIPIPDFFKYGNYTGSTKSWKSLGSWAYKLNIQENGLSAQTLSDLEKIKQHAKSRIDLIQKVYEYMQSRTRYVSIQLGIGGYKSMDASLVDKYGYGDCKALSNYTQTLLKHVGVKSYWALVYAGKYASDVDTDAHCFQFNHVILCVPGTSDTTWLECTDQLQPFGFLGNFTDNRHVLLITPEGGKLIKTPDYGAEQNTLKRTAFLAIEFNGNAEGSILTRYSGIQSEDLTQEKNYAIPDKQKDFIYEEIGIPASISHFSLKPFDRPIPSIDESLHLTLKQYAMTFGNRMLLPLNPVNREDALAKLTDPRRSRFRIRRGYHDRDSITYKLPAGYSIEYLPKPGKIQSEFGSYSFLTKMDTMQNTITYIRNMIMHEGLYSPGKYKDFIMFINKIGKNDNLKAALILKSKD